MIYEYIIEPAFLVKLVKQSNGHQLFHKREWGCGTHRYCLGLLNSDWSKIPMEQALTMKQKQMYDYVVEKIVVNARLNRNPEYINWDNKRKWKQNVANLLTEQGYHPVRMVFSKNRLKDKCFYRVDDIGLNSPREEEFSNLWKASDNGETDRNAKELVGLLGLFFSASKEITWVDPYFNTEKRYLRVLGEILSTINSSHGRYRNHRSISIITSYEKIGNPDYFWKELARFLKPLSMKNTDLRVVLAGDGTGTQYKFHDRFMLSELAGFCFPGGTDEKPGEDKWFLKMLLKEELRRRWEFFSNFVPPEKLFCKSLRIFEARNFKAGEFILD